MGLGEACRLAKDEMEYDYKHVVKLNKLFMDGLNKKLSHIVLNGDE